MAQTIHADLDALELEKGELIELARTFHFIQTGQQPTKQSHLIRRVLANITLE